MELTKLFVTGRSATVQLDDGGLYHTRKPYTLTLNDQPWGTADTVITSLYGLWPDTRYTLRVFDGDTQVEKLTFTTEEESFTLNVRRFGAVGDEKRNKAGLQAYSVHAEQVAGAGEKRR